MTLLGAIIAGGASRRFGSDKAAALLDSIPLIEHVAAALRPQVDALVVVGRAWPGLEMVADEPAPGLGPLGGLLGALTAAHARGHGDVLTASCDVPNLPTDLVDLLGPGPAVWLAQPLLGRWPAHLAEPLAVHLAAGERSMRSWIAAAGASEVAIDRPVSNVNWLEDLDALRRPAGPRSSQ